MSATVDNATDWQTEVLDLKRQGLTSAQIAEAVGKHAATVRKVIARAKDDEIPGQTTVDDHLPPDRIVWTGENWPEFAKFLGRPEGSPLISYNFDLPAGEDPDGEPCYVTARPGDTVIRTGDTYEVEVNVEPEDDPEYTDSDPLEQFRSEAGEAVGPMPPDPNPPEPLGVEVRLAGTRQMAIDFGSDVDLPMGGTLVIRSEKMASGFFARGDVITGTFTARVVDVGSKEKFDKASEEFRAEPQPHVALITEISLAK